MIHSSNAPTFWELCTEFDEENEKDSVYLSVCMFLLRNVWGTMEGNMNFLIAQRTKTIRGFKFKKDSDVYKWLSERHQEDEISAFEKKLGYLI